jgi:phage tail-like protein
MSKLTDGAMDEKALIKYLPAIYQEDDASRNTLEKYLSIFGSGLKESEDAISKVSRSFDPLSTPEEFLPWLAGWLSLDLYERMGERNREFIMNAVELYKWKGTARGLKLLVERLTERRCDIREFEKNVFRTYCKEDEATGPGMRSISRTVDSKMDLSKMGTFEDEIHYTVDTNPDRLYSRTIVGIFILLEGGEGFPEYSPEYRDQFQRIIETFLPVFVRAEIYIRNQEAPRRSHPTSLIEESCTFAIYNYSDLKSYEEGSDAKAGGLTNSPDYRTYYRLLEPTY